MSNLGASYSQIILPEAYNTLMSDQHLYITLADKFITKTIGTFALTHPGMEVVELGCGPGRVLLHTQNVENIVLTGVDIDASFLAYARNLIKDQKIKIVLGDAYSYKHPKPVQAFYSQGFHHHIPKGDSVHKYLFNIHKQLTPGGYYIVSDEFVPNYDNEVERSYRLVVWYAHIIAHALYNGFHYLAEEEAKTLLDDLHEGRMDSDIKTSDQVELVLSKVSVIDKLARKGHIETCHEAVDEFTACLKNLYNTQLQGISEMDLSRGDYKVCDRVFREEAENADFMIEKRQTFGPIDTIGGMAVYVLRKGV